jgi:hypothetical protein
VPLGFSQIGVVLPAKAGIQWRSYKKDAGFPLSRE